VARVLTAQRDRWYGLAAIEKGMSVSEQSGGNSAELNPTTSRMPPYRYHFKPPVPARTAAGRARAPRRERARVGGACESFCRIWCPRGRQIGFTRSIDRPTSSSSLCGRRSAWSPPSSRLSRVAGRSGHQPSSLLNARRDCPSHARRRWSGQQLMTRSAGIPASRACAIAKST
jgi:hypothetical protein